MRTNAIISLMLPLYLARSAFASSSFRSLGALPSLINPPLWTVLPLPQASSCCHYHGHHGGLAFLGNNVVGSFKHKHPSVGCNHLKRSSSRTLAIVPTFHGHPQKNYPNRRRALFSIAASASSASEGAANVNNSKDDTEPLVAVSDTYDGGNGEFISAEIVDVEDEKQDCDVVVKVGIRPDPFTELENKQHFQSFSFRSTLNPTNKLIQTILQNKQSNKQSTNPSTIKVKYILQNAGEASYPQAWSGSSVFVTTKSTPFDPDSWVRTKDTQYVENEDNAGYLTWSHEFDISGAKTGSSSMVAYFAYFPPYSYERHLGLVARCAEQKGCTLQSLGQTLSGREIDCLTIGTGPRVCWIIHRQHPGESMAEFYAEGLLYRLLGLDCTWTDDRKSDTSPNVDKVAQKAREMYTFHIVPNINPDGSANGYLRTNVAGSNLNREWAPSPSPPSTAPEEGSNDNIETNDENQIYEAPTLHRSPEVYHLLRRMDETSCDAFLDIHGDEALPFNFLAGSQGMPNWDKRLESLHGAFLASYERANPDMQRKVSYDPDKPMEGMKNICSNQIAERFDCFSGTLEMPFKELWVPGIATIADGEQGQREGFCIGWGPARARKLGASVLDALCYVWPFLREDEEFWEILPEEDAYVHPTSKY